jgi:FtsP/CotA-like multicopper oxidase with cupredoxin domain
LTLVGSALVGAAQASAGIPGLTNSTFTLTATPGYVSGGDGLSLYSWGFAPSGGPMQYPGPTLIVFEGTLVTVNLKNMLPLGSEPVSIVFPGQAGVLASGGTAGVLTREAPADGGLTTVTYTFTASRPGTFMYHSGTHMDLQIEMGLVGALIVRPAAYPTSRAYDHVDSAYDREYLFMMTEMDYDTHWRVEVGLTGMVDTTMFHPEYWFINGRNFPDTILPDGAAWLKNQPYGSLVWMHPGERILVRFVGAGREAHPLHPHSNHVRIIARDAGLLSSGPGAGADLAPAEFTVSVVPGETVDAIFEWTGAKLGWDMYGHAPSDPLEPYEYAPDHGKPFPLTLPGQLEVDFGIVYSGSPFLGALGDIPPGVGGLNFFGGYFHPWHSHHEHEVVNNDIFPGGLFTLLVIAPWSVPIP